MAKEMKKKGQEMKEREKMEGRNERKKGRKKERKKERNKKKSKRNKKWELLSREREREREREIAFHLKNSEFNEQIHNRSLETCLKQVLLGFIVWSSMLSAYVWLC